MAIELSKQEAAGFSGLGGGKYTKPNASNHVMRDDYRKKTVLTYAETADMLGLSISTIYKLVSAGKFGETFKRGAYRIPIEGIYAYRKGEKP